MEEQYDTIIYDENWQDVTQPEYPVFREAGEELSEEHTRKAPKPMNPPGQLVLTLQLIVCLVLGLCALVLKGAGGEVYAAVREWYYTNLSHSAILDTEKPIDFDALLRKATPDEIQAVPDEN
ncbi:MAG: hypothetical protein ABS876_06895 [Ruminococcus sp.]